MHMQETSKASSLTEGSSKSYSEGSSERPRFEVTARARCWDSEG